MLVRVDYKKLIEELERKTYKEYQLPRTGSTTLLDSAKKGVFLYDWCSKSSGTNTLEHLCGAYFHILFSRHLFSTPTQLTIHELFSVIKGNMNRSMTVIYVIKVIT